MGYKKLQDASMEYHTELPCFFCGRTLLASEDFYPSYSKNSIMRKDDSGIHRQIICKECAQALYDHLYSIYRTRRKAIYHFCATLDVYFNVEFIEKLRKTDIGKYVSAYYRLMEKSARCANKTFADTKIGAEESLAEPEALETDENGLTKEDIRNRIEIMSVFHYDPFEKEPIEQRRKLYRDLVTMADPAMSDDLVRQKAAIEIVRSFDRVEALTEIINKFKDQGEDQIDSKTLKTLIETKNKETDMITKFSKDHGFAERYATAKSRGTGTLSAAIRDMEDFDYDDGKVNFYDIKTSATMQQAADISMRAIMSQLNLSEADYVDMLKRQREELTTIRRDRDRIKEELRLVYKQITKQELLKELAHSLASKGMGEDEIFKAVLSEIHFEDKAIAQEVERLLSLHEENKQ